MAIYRVLILLGLPIFSLDFASSLNHQCYFKETNQNSTVKRLYKDHVINNTKATIQILAPTFHGCDTFCNSTLSSGCLGFTYFHDNGTCLIFNETSLKYALGELSDADTVLIMATHCTTTTTGIWSSWNDIQFVQPPNDAWFKYFYIRECLVSNDGCHDAFCIISSNGTNTTICSHLYCKDKSEYSTITEAGIQMLRIREKQVPIHVQVDTEGIAWIYIQRRFDGSVDFYRDWNAYKDGFGNMSGEFWLGNDIIHELTKHSEAKIRFDLSKGEEWKYAEYKDFKIEDESQSYRLSVGDYSGNAGDSYDYHDGMKFTTKDSDNDVSSSNCAVSYKGAWWFKACHHSHLNGLYLNGSINGKAQGMRWGSYSGSWFSLPKTIMKIRFY